ncbi:protein YgfX [Uliginosibacterium sp. sgz301328]|uniref:protein YgfX n=1 Tax=Uliginosibacterium sp. sgz301328 TaxID=3243764 RepID=UPI00359E5AD7
MSGDPSRGSGASAPLPRISLSPSRCLRVVAWLAHLVPCLAALSPGIPMPVRVAVFALAACSAVITKRRHRRCENDWLELQGAGAARLVRGGDVHDIDILPGCTNLGWVVVLHWRAPDGAIVRHAFARDGMDAALWRQLRIWLRWTVQPFEAGAGESK